MEKKLPKNWITVQVSDIAITSSGGTPNTAKKEYWDGDIPWINSGKLKDEYIFEPSRFITNLGLKESSAKLFPINTVVIALTGATTGKLGYLKLETSTNQSVTGIFPNDNYNSKFLFYQLKSLRNKILNQALGSAQPHINKKIVDETKIKFPPLSEQNRIVEKLDRLFGQLEVIKSSMEKIPVLLKNFRQQVLTQAVTGKLTEDFEYEPIVEEIIADRKKWFIDKFESSKKLGIAKPKKIIERVNYDKSFLEKYLFKKVDISFIEEISGNKDNALKAGPFGSSLKKEFYVENGYKIYGQEQVIKGDEKYGNYYINETKYNELKSCEVSEGDLLISLVGTIGKTLVLSKDFEKGIINPRLLKFSFHERISPKYIQIYLQCDISKKFLSENSHGGTMDVLNMGILKVLPIPIPSTEEQQEIVSRVESLFAKADVIEEKYKNLKAKIETLPQTILHKAFKGELSEQLESDGDARDLVEEIAALKNGEKPKKIVAKKYVQPDDEVLRIVAEESTSYPSLSAKDKKVQRKMLATHIINQSLEDKSFGKTKFEKLLHLVECHVLKRDLNQNYSVQAAGPYDGSFTKTFWDEVLKSKWFAFEQQGTLKRIISGENQTKSVKEYGYFSDEEKQKINNFIAIFEHTNYERPEIVSTLYAVWNNRIKRNEAITDDLLKEDFLNWDSGKAKYRDRLDKALDWMRENNVVPNGWGKEVKRAKKK